MHLSQQAFRVWQQIGVPRPASPSSPTRRLTIVVTIPMPVHIQNHHISWNLVCFQVCHDITIILCRIRSILTIPVSEYIIGRQRNFSCYLSIIGHCLFVIVAITKKISIHGMFVSTRCPPRIPYLIIINESIRTSSIGTRSCPSIINHCPS